MDTICRLVISSEQAMSRALSSVRDFSGRSFLFVPLSLSEILTFYFLYCFISSLVGPLSAFMDTICRLVISSEQAMSRALSSVRDFSGRSFLFVPLSTRPMSNLSRIHSSLENPNSRDNTYFQRRVTKLSMDSPEFCSHELKIYRS